MAVAEEAEEKPKLKVVQWKQLHPRFDATYVAHCSKWHMIDLQILHRGPRDSSYSSLDKDLFCDSCSKQIADF